MQERILKKCHNLNYVAKIPNMAVINHQKKKIKNITADYWSDDLKQQELGTITWILLYLLVWGQ